jgi:hypothetical protein
MAGDPLFENLGLSSDEVGKFTQEGSFLGSDDRYVRCYDDVKLVRPLAVRMSSGDRWATALSGATATVLSYTLGPKSVAQLECYVGEQEFAFGFEDLSHLKLHMTNEEKYAR